MPRTGGCGRPSSSPRSGAGDAAGHSTHRRGADARLANADGLPDGGRTHAFRAAVAADWRVPRSRAQAPRVRGRRVVHCARGRHRAGRVVAAPPVDSVAVRRRLHHRRGEYDGRQRRADRAHADRAPGPAGRSTRQKFTRLLGGGSHRARCRRRPDQADRRATGAARHRRAAVQFLYHPAGRAGARAR